MAKKFKRKIDWEEEYKHLYQRTVDHLNSMVEYLENDHTHHAADMCGYFRANIQNENYYFEFPEEKRPE